MQNDMTLSRAKMLTLRGVPGPRDVGYFALIEFLARDEGDAEALGILLNHRNDFCRAVSTDFETHIQPLMQKVAHQFGQDYKLGTSQLVLVYGGKSHTFYIRVERKAANHQRRKAA